MNQVAAGISSSQVGRQFRDALARHRMVLPGDRVLVAVSGGPDSTALLALFCDAARDLRIGVHAAHLNHAWRGPRAERDADFVRRLALRFRIAVTVGQLDPEIWRRRDVKDGSRRQSSREARARTLRLRFLRDTAQAIGATRIALGHTRDDQAESLLMRLLRGSGRRGLAGTYPVVDGVLIRPLLGVRRRAILAYLRRRRLPYRIDASNLDLRLTRNRIRRRLIPRLEKDYNPEVVEALAQAADLLRDEESLLGELAEAAYGRTAQKEAGAVAFETSALAGLPAALRRRLVRLACGTVRGHLRGITSRHVEEVLHLTERRAGGEISLPGGLRAIVSSRTLRFEPRPAAHPQAMPREALCPIPGEVALPGFGLRLRARLAQGDLRDLAPGPGRACLDADLLVGPLLIRPRRPGDRFRPLGAPGSRKIKTFLIDRKVPVDERGHVPLVLSGDRIAWVVGHQIDDRFKVTPGTRRVLVLEKEPR